jgi:hypothetical protein
VATSCTQDVRPYDEQAARIIEGVRNSVQAAGPGARVPPLPQELIDLEQKRKARVLAAVEEIRTALGPGAFLYFDMLVRRNLNPDLRRPQRAPVPPAPDSTTTPKQTGAHPEPGGEVYFDSRIYWDETNHVVTGYGSTIVNYPAAYYYKAVAEVTLTKDGDEVNSGANQNPFGNAEVWVDSEQIPGAKYGLDTHHRLDAMYKYGQTVEKCEPHCSWWDDHYGFSLEAGKSKK